MYIKKYEAIHFHIEICIINRGKPILYDQTLIHSKLRKIADCISITNEQVCEDKTAVVVGSHDEKHMLAFNWNVESLCSEIS